MSGLLLLDELRALAPNSLEDGALEMLLSAAENAIEILYGPTGSPFTETYEGASRYLVLRRRAASITSVVETDGSTDTTLAADDYELGHDRVSLRRLDYGTNARLYWGLRTTVVYPAFDDVPERQRLAAALVKQDLNYEPGVTSEQIGAWMEQKAANSVWNYTLEREAILQSFGLLAAPQLGWA